VIAAVEYADRAMRAYGAMQSRFCREDGLYRRDGFPRWPRAAAHLWPCARALVATLDLAGLAPALVPAFDADAEITQRLTMLERYWDPTGPLPAYASDVVGTRFGGDRYYDDNAWVGLALVQLERMRPGADHLHRAAELFRFAAAGWDRRGDVQSPGGVFWVEQGRGVGGRNHDRNTVSNGPNAQLGLHLAELTGRSPAVPGPIAGREMYEWVNAALDAGGADGEPATGLFWDKWRGDGSLDRTLWSYNQGSMVGANVLLGRGAVDAAAAAERARYVGRAEAIARKALCHFGAAGLVAQPPAFNAIFFRNLLLLHDVTGDAALRPQLLDAIRGYADHVWAQLRDARDCVRVGGRAVTLLDQSGMVQVLALLAWDPQDYAKLA
jgi:Glycosyl hydrolase family 76